MSMRKASEAKHKRNWQNPFKSVPFFYADTHTAKLSKRAYDALPNTRPGKTLPKKWFYKSPEYFNRKHGELGTIVWAKTWSYSALFIAGQKVLKLWTNHPNVSRLEVNEVLYGQLEQSLSTTDHKPKAFKGFYGQFSITTMNEVDIVMKEVRKIYNV